MIACHLFCLFFLPARSLRNPTYEPPPPSTTTRMHAAGSHRAAAVMPKSKNAAPMLPFPSTKSATFGFTQHLSPRRRLPTTPLPPPALPPALIGAQTRSLALIGFLILGTASLGHVRSCAFGANWFQVPLQRSNHVNKQQIYLATCRSAIAYTSSVSRAMWQSS